MIAQIRRWVENRRQRLTYVLITSVLLGILQLGHRTHWSLSFAAAKESNSSPSKKLMASAPATVKKALAPAVESEQPLVIEMPDEAVRKSGIQIEHAQLRPIRESIVANGATSYNQDALAQLSVRVPGHIWRVEKRVGQLVAKGDCLAVIDAVAVGEAKTEFLKSVVDRELKSKLLERLQPVAGEVAEKSLRQAEADAREAKLRWLSAQQRLINLGLPVKWDELAGLDDETLAERIRFIGIPDSLRRSLDPQMTTANLLPLTAPFDGIVIGRDAVIGEVVTPEKAQFVVADVSTMWILLDVHKEDAGLVRRGQLLEFDVEGVSHTVVGRIDWISTEMDEQTRTLRVRAEVDNPLVKDGGPDGVRLLKANTFGSGRVILRESTAAVAVPPAAVHRDGQGRFVFVRRDGSFVRRNVKLGVTTDEYCEILSGVTIRDSIATAGSHVLKAELVTLSAE